MNKIKILSPTQYFFDHQKVMRERIDAGGIEAKRPLAHWDEMSVSNGISTGEQSYVVSHGDQLLGQPGNYALRTAVIPRRNAFM